MKRKRFTKEQVIGILKAHEAGVSAADLARKYGFSENTIYNWKSKYGGMEVSDAKRLRELENENSWLKKLLAETMLDKEALEAALRKKMYGPPLFGKHLLTNANSLHKCIRPLASELLLQLGHDEIRTSNSDQFEATYLRSDVLEKRRTLMYSWSQFVTGES